MICSNLSSKEKPYLSVRILYPCCENITNEYEDSVIKVNFKVDEKLLYIQLYNKTKNRIVLEWENVRLDGSAMAFDTDRRLKMDEPKADEVIFSGNYSTHNALIPKKAISDSYIDKWWNIEEIKKKGEVFSKINIPIRVNDSPFDYVFHIGVACVIDGVRTKINVPSEEEVASIHEGMSYEDVISIIGTPMSYIEKKDEKVLIANYFNGLSIEFQAEYKVHVFMLAHNVNHKKAKEKTKVTKIDKSQMHHLTPELYFKNLYK